jgi:hypothetical protein
MKKAFIFTLDALFAVSIMAVFFVVYSFEMNVPKETYWLPVTANTYMTTMDKSGVFYVLFDHNDKSWGDSYLKAYLNNLSNNVNANIVVKVYSCTKVSDSVYNFNLINTFNADKGIVSQTQQVHVKRVFARVNGRLFGIAELTLSYG